jgi:hypothetical protein
MFGSENIWDTKTPMWKQVAAAFAGVMIVVTAAAGAFILIVPHLP